MSEFSRTAQEVEQLSADLESISSAAAVVFTPELKARLDGLARQLEASVRPKVNKFLGRATEPDESKRLYSEAMVMKVLDVAERVEGLAQRLVAVEGDVQRQQAEHERLVQMSAEQKAVTLRQKFPHLSALLIRKALVTHRNDLDAVTAHLLAIPAMPQCLEEELKGWPASHPAATYFSPVVVTIDEEKPLEWQVGLVGPRFSPYFQGEFHLVVAFPPQYPLRPPSCRFLTPIHHPYVTAHQELVLPELQAWDPGQPPTVAQLLWRVHQALARPLAPLAVAGHKLPQAYHACRADSVQFEAKARSDTSRHAHPERQRAKTAQRVSVRCFLLSVARRFSLPVDALLLVLEFLLGTPCAYVPPPIP
eukprot:GGOE01057733.1.p1 GENE.GGOE01057733.1~~GGOE01057733.1.p1  ORF type:complete len:364 (-),score=119.70 GGOE01057733.1:108-1199(-)